MVGVCVPYRCCLCLHGGETALSAPPTASAAERVPGVEVMRFGAPLTFANKDLFRGAVIKLVDKSDSERRLAEKHGLPQKPPLQVLFI